MVELQPDQELTVTMASGQQDSFLQLLGPDGEHLVSNDDFGRGVDSQIRFVAEEAGEYEIQAFELSGRAISYDLSVVVIE